MRAKAPARPHHLTRLRRSSQVVTTLGLTVLAVILAVLARNQPLTVLAQNDSSVRKLAPLKTVPIPQPANISRYIKDQAAAITLGKALFWDQQVGSDGQACASCHFQAAADSRSKNQLNPGFRAVPPDMAYHLPSGPGPNYQLTVNDFPFHKLAVPDDQNSAVLFDTNDIASSQGVRNFTFTSINPRSNFDNGNSSLDPVFNVNSVNVRRVEPRNTPSVINAVFNFRNFWDGRARNEFNGATPIGKLDPNAKVLRIPGLGQAPELVSLTDGSHAELALNNSSLASQAVGPPLSDLEMSYAGRTFTLLGRKMVPRQALALQLVALDDSVLGSFSNSPFTGLTKTYGEMIRDAFHSEWWDSSNIIQVNADGSISVLPAPRSGKPLADNQFTMMEFNFSLFWGLAIQAYETTLVADQSRVDLFLEGNAAALTDQEKRGMDIFQGKGRCIRCHSGPETTSASVANIQVQGVTQQIVLGDGSLALIDTGFFNTAVRHTNDDLGIGATIGPLNAPLSEARRTAAPGQKVAVDGAFKVPQLRNVELTAPYFHNGGDASVDQVVEFYDRGGNFAAANVANFAPNIQSLHFTNAEDDALVAFLNALTDERVRYEKAPFDHPSLVVPNGALGTNLSVINDGTGNAREDHLSIPAVGKNGRTTPPKKFLE
jgi:cytochrome c peroxidase